MLELLFEGLIYTVPQATGRAIVYCVTFGRVHCSDGVAEIVGIAFWVIVFLVVAFFLLRK